MKPAEVLRERVRAAQGERSHRAFAKKLGISSGTLQRVKNSPQNVTLRTLERIAKALKTTPAELISNEKGKVRQRP
jgi:transcriptional regulator with XRE-family HTH domain